MSINMKVLPLDDDELERVLRSPRRLDDSAIVDGSVDLYEHWRRIDYLLGGQSFLMQGDQAVDDPDLEPIHVIRSANAPQAAERVEELTDENVRRQLEPARMRAAGLWVSEYEDTDAMVREVSPAIGELREGVRRAVEENKGLVIWRYEWL